MIFWRTGNRKNVLMLRVDSNNYTQTIKYIKQIVIQFDSQYNGEIKFLDDNLQKMYSKEKKIAHFIEFVALWCLLLSLAGITGLMIFISKDRIKEIGIRKVNGATIVEILLMLNK